MNINQRFHLRQEHHEITFFAYDIDSVELTTPDKLSKIFVPECSVRDSAKGCEACNTNGCSANICCECSEPHLQKLLLDGWYVGNKYGFLDKDSYHAVLQTGIRVPVNKEIHDAWEQGWEKGWFKDKVYQIET